MFQLLNVNDLHLEFGGGRSLIILGQVWFTVVDSWLLHQANSDLP